MVEAEESLGHHSSGRSATFSHFGIGNRIVRELTRHSRAFFLDAGEGVLARHSPALFVATREMVPALDRLAEDMAVHTDSLRPVDEAATLAKGNPLLKPEQLQTVVIDGISPGVVKPSHKNSAEIGQAVRAALDPLWKPDADVKTVLSGVCTAIQPLLAK